MPKTCRMDYTTVSALSKLSTSVQFRSPQKRISVGWLLGLVGSTQGPEWHELRDSRKNKQYDSH